MATDSLTKDWGLEYRFSPMQFETPQAICDPERIDFLHRVKTFGLKGFIREREREQVSDRTKYQKVCFVEEKSSSVNRECSVSHLITRDSRRANKRV
jgi:hypothetical protein